ncbi:hypothetical protein [Aliivibrio fischeri]|uniref:DUF1508 domain-containing protein n=1 Tax=Aliivibrio fischeri SR5 TaxID=1088719 RepID=A0AAV3EPK3_ALIFS|nr:hypothetical protein [Aliivibrio fischeri]EHN68429.1 hypothetical protein VFSR5_A1014 [Aliivibrio fischeri SR5]MUJ27825.1 hypothetical protein [Aliivibrio fischeri]
MTYRGFKIKYSQEKQVYFLFIRNKEKKIISIESKNLIYIKKKIDDVIDFKTLEHSSSNNSFWTSISK